MTNGVLPLALSQGDPAGIGPDIALQAWLKRDALGVPPFLYIGDPAVLQVRARQLELEVAVEETGTERANDVFARALPVLGIPTGVDVLAGKPHVANARGTINAIETAVSPRTGSTPAASKP